mgnify:CR=1 FL=1
MALANLLRRPKIVIVLVVLVLAIIAIRPNPWASGVVIKAVERESPAYLAGVSPPKPSVQPMSRERILELAGKTIQNSADWFATLSQLSPNISITMRTNKAIYNIVPAADAAGRPWLGLTVADAPKTNLRRGLDLEGGTRVVLRPIEPVPPETLSELLSVMEQRLNVYGITDMTLRSTSEGYIVLEMAGISAPEISELIAGQGKFEAKLTNLTVFVGREIMWVCRTSDCSGIDPSYGCQQTKRGWLCRFRFAITLSPEAAARQAELTAGLSVVTDGEAYLNESLELYLDDALVDQLKISAELKGRAVTDIAISGFGSGPSKEEAISDALASMKRLQTVLITGTLPVRLEIEKVDSLSPLLGQTFTKSVAIVLLLGIAVVVLIVSIRYRRVILALPITATLLFELVILLGVAALIKWNIDLAAIAGIIVSIGTGTDDQIIITDEILGRTARVVLVWRERLKRAFFVIFGAYATILAAMIPLWFAGAGLLRGFALTTILGLTIGVLLTRPAYAALLEEMIRGRE